MIESIFVLYGMVSLFVCESINNYCELLYSSSNMKYKGVIRTLIFLLFKVLNTSNRNPIFFICKFSLGLAVVKKHYSMISLIIRILCRGPN